MTLTSSRFLQDAMLSVEEKTHLLQAAVVVDVADKKIKELLNKNELYKSKIAVS